MADKNKVRSRTTVKLGLIFCFILLYSLGSFADSSISHNSGSAGATDQPKKLWGLSSQQVLERSAGDLDVLGQLEAQLKSALGNAAMQELALAVLRLGRLGALEDLVYVRGSTAKVVGELGAIGHQTSIVHEFPLRVQGGKAGLRREFRQAPSGQG